MSVLRIRNKETGVWEDIPAIVGPQGEQGPPGPPGKDGKNGAPGEPGASGLSRVVNLYDAEQTMMMTNNTDYRCTEPVTHLLVTGFAADPVGRGEVWSVQFAAGDSITVELPDTVVWNYGATPVFTPGSEYRLLFTPMLNGKVLGVWNEVEA